MNYLKDSWLQIFGLLALASGALAARNWQAPNGPHRRNEASRPAAIPIALSEPASPDSNTLKSKAPGKWVVDAALAADADTAKLGDALSNALVGDTVYVRAGTYKGSVSIKRDIVIVGLGLQRDIVIDGDQAGPTLTVDSAKATIKNVTIIHSGARPGKAVESRDATLELVTVALKAGPQDVGLNVSGGAVTADFGAIEGGHKALDAHNGATVALDHMTVTKAKTGVFVQDASARLSDTVLADNERGITVVEQGQATIVNGAILRNSVGVWANRGGQVKVSSSRFIGGTTGVLADERGRAEIESCAFFDLAGNALSADSSGELADKGSTILRTKSVAAMAQSLATLSLIDTQIDDGLGDAVGVVDGASASLSGVKLTRNARAGLSIRDARAVRVEDSVVSGQKRCALEVSGAALTLKTTRMTGNLCGVAFYGEATLDVDACDLTGNLQGPFLYPADQKKGVIVRGQNNRPRNLSSLIQ